MRWVAAIALALAGCGQSEVNEEAIYDRAEMIRVCGDGWVGRDPVTGRLAWGNGWSRTLVAKGVTADEVCDGKRAR